MTNTVSKDASPKESFPPVHDKLILAQHKQYLTAQLAIITEPQILSVENHTKQTALCNDQSLL
jgi:hypothetical protein